MLPSQLMPSLQLRLPLLQVRHHKHLRAARPVVLAEVLAAVVLAVVWA